MVMATIAGFKNNGSLVEGELFCLEALFPDNKIGLKDPHYAFKASTDPDTMYLHEAMREPDKEQFKDSMIKEVKDQMDNGNFVMVKRSVVPTGELAVPTVWLMKRKRDTVKQEEAHGRTVKRTVLYGSYLVGRNPTHHSGTTCS
jgi:hypothetical protein